MNRRWIYWWIGNIFWIITFGILAAIIWLREVDGAGVTQTPELKSVAFIVLLITFILPIIIQVVWLIVNLRKSRKK
ncbi:DUF3923 domain-containing protein [Bacillus cereus]|uniref:DUF3923 family protein n=1 Tax=Bacillus nitratireducens TaxID=2026193 RepID=A0ABU6PCF2_9BACI|nr:DUF3923 family protein [Bacillus nitratireducens]EJS56714.1 hypothetical protein ICG_02255 [Bacillus cereus BAG1X1-3]EOO73701.1 hypothetical protein IC7_02645 [Bacillus cereus BAG1O-1]OSX92687.1 hypothetical protein BTJ45_02148 [Bacillus mycoides]PDY23669.1 DUF3923 domain-containing protein [Bacillus cereus]MDR4171722.1 DUF3923 family protein [Bacillus nitratireducens]